MKTTATELGYFLRVRFAELGTTSASVARKLGLNKATVSSWVTGRAIPRGASMRKLQAVLDLDDAERLRLYDMASMAKGGQ